MGLSVVRGMKKSGYKEWNYAFASGWLGELLRKLLRDPSKIVQITADFAIYELERNEIARLVDDGLSPTQAFVNVLEISEPTAEELGIPAASAERLPG
jgi:hypothetical protein